MTTSDYGHDFGSHRPVRPAENTQVQDPERRGGLFIDADGEFYSPAAERAYRLLHGETGTR